MRCSGQFERSALRIYELLTIGFTWIKPRVYRLWLPGAPLFEEDHGLVSRSHSIVWDGKYCCENLIFVGIEHLNDMPIRKRIRQPEDILPGWQHYSWNLDRLVKCQDCFLVPLVAKSGQAQEERTAH